MKSSRLIGGLAVVTAGAVAALLIFGPVSNTDVDSARELLFPDLMSVINDVSSVTTLHEGRELGASVVEGNWVVPQRGGYPASADAVHKIIVAMANIRKLEAMTKKPERYAKLGLETPDHPQAYAVQVTLRDRAGASLASVIMGYRDPSKVDEHANEIFVRRPDDPQTWLVEADVPHATKPADLLDTTVSDINLARVHKVVVRHADGHEIAVEKQSPDEKDFVLTNPPVGTQVLYDWAINDIGRALTGLYLVDVWPAKESDFDGPLFELELHTFDGLVVQLQSAVSEQGHVARLSARASASTAAVAASHEALLSPAALGEEIQTLNRRWSGWAYRFSNYRYGTFSKPMHELVQNAQD